MNSQDYRNLQEAYLKVYQELDEKVLGVDPEQRAAAAAERKSGNKRLPPSRGKEYANNQKKSISYMNKLTKNNKIIPGMAHEEVVSRKSPLCFLASFSLSAFISLLP